MTEAVRVTICYSRCLYCGRRTPHEACHAHAHALNPSFYPGDDDGDWERLRAAARYLPAETCSDSNCPVWEPEERERFEPWYAEWVKSRAAVIEAVHEVWVRSMRSQGYADHPFVAVKDEDSGYVSTACGAETRYGACKRRYEKHHSRMRPWSELTPREQFESVPEGLDRAFKAGYEAKERQFEREIRAGLDEFNRQSEEWRQATNPGYLWAISVTKTVYHARPDNGGVEGEAICSRGRRAGTLVGGSPEPNLSRARKCSSCLRVIAERE